MITKFLRSKDILVPEDFFSLSASNVGHMRILKALVDTKLSSFLILSPYCVTLKSDIKESRVVINYFTPNELLTALILNQLWNSKDFDGYSFITSYAKDAGIDIEPENKGLFMFFQEIAVSKFYKVDQIIKNHRDIVKYMLDILNKNAPTFPRVSVDTTKVETLDKIQVRYFTKELTISDYTYGESCTYLFSSVYSAGLYPINSTLGSSECIFNNQGVLQLSPDNIIKNLKLMVHKDFCENPVLARLEESNIAFSIYLVELVNNVIKEVI